jgi:transcriptional regulator with XRE-family HTH domain
MPKISVGSRSEARDREIVRCVGCALVQFRTKGGYCRRCLHVLPPNARFLLPPAAPPSAVAEDKTCRNCTVVKNVGQRIRQLRESRNLNQNDLQAQSHVSRSYLSRIEGGVMTPGIATLEKIAEALGVGLNRFFIPVAKGEALLEDPFIQELRPYLRQLDWQQWESIRARLAAISEVSY